MFAKYRLVPADSSLPTNPSSDVKAPQFGGDELPQNPGSGDVPQPKQRVWPVEEVLSAMEEKLKNRARKLLSFLAASPLDVNEGNLKVIYPSDGVEGSGLPSLLTFVLTDNKKRPWDARRFLRTCVKAKIPSRLLSKTAQKL